MGRFYHRVQGVLHRTVVVQAMLTLAWSITIFATAFGTALIAAPDNVLRVATFEHSFRFAPPHVWGIGFLAFAALTALALYGSRRDLAPFPIWGLALLTCVWGAFTVPAVAASSGALTAVIIYPFAAFVMLIVGAAIDQQGEGNAT